MTTVSIKDNISKWLKPAVHEEMSSEWYEKRLESVESILDDADLEKSLDLLRYFFEISSKELNEEIDKEIQGGDIQYEAGNEFLNRLLIGVCLIRLFNKSSDQADCVGLAYSTYEFQKRLAKNKSLAVEIDLERVVDNYLDQESLRVREYEKPEYSVNTPGTSPLKLKSLNESIDAIGQPAASDFKAPLEKLSQGLEAFRNEYVAKTKEILEAHKNSFEYLDGMMSVAREEK